MSRPPAHGSGLPGPHDEPIEDRLADRLSTAESPSRARSAAVHALRALGRVDRGVYLAVARLPTPALDVPLRELSHAANYSKPWFATAALLAAVGGRRGRRAALTGTAAIAAASLAVNLPMKLAGNRDRPDREAAGVPSPRWVRMPDSSSFPSGHSASAVAFATAVSDVLPALRVPLGAAAVTVAFSRVYTGVHYPGDVAVGMAVGAGIGRLTARAGRRVGPGVGPGGSAG